MASNILKELREGGNGGSAGSVNILEQIRQAKAAMQQQNEQPMVGNSVPPAPPGSSLSAFDETYVAPLPTGQEFSDAASRTGTALNDIVRSTASGMTFGLADEAAAAADTATGLGAGGTYEQNLANQRGRDAAIDPATQAIFGTLGALGTGGGLARQGISLLKGAKPTVASMGSRGAAEGATYGGLHGFGAGEGFENRIDQTLTGAGAGALVGGLAGGIGGQLAGRATKTPPTVQQLRDEADVIYKRMLDTGERVDPVRFSAMADDLAQFAQNKGYLPENAPRVWSGLNAFSARKGESPTLREVDGLRRVLKRAGESSEKSERNASRILLRRLDSAIDDLVPEIKPARALWQRAAKGEQIENLIKRAQKRRSQYAGGNLENALRTEFRQLAMNDKKMRAFSPAEQQAIETVGEGGTIGNLMRDFGKYSPTAGVVSSGVGAGGGAGLATLAGVDPLIGAAALPAVGLLGRGGATLATARNARNAAELMRAGGKPYLAPIDPALQQQLINRIRGAGITGGVSPSLLDPLGRNR